MRGERRTQKLLGICQAFPASCHGNHATPTPPHHPTLPLPPFLTFSPVFDVRSKAAVIFFFPLSLPPPSLCLSVRREGARVGKVSCCCFGTSLPCDVAAFLKGDRGEKASFFTNANTPYGSFKNVMCCR